MLHRFIKILSLTTLSIILAATIVSAKKKQALDQLSTEILESIQSFNPVLSTSAGIHSYDHRLADYSSKSVNAMVKKLTSYTTKLYKYKGAKLSTDQTIDYKLLKSNVEIALLDLKQIKWHKKSPQLYIDEVVDGIYQLLLSQHAPMSEKLYSIIARMKAVPALLITAQKNIKKPPEPYLDLALESLESAQDFYKQVAGELMQQFPDRADDILKYATKAREAMNDFSIFLSDITPGSETSFSIGKKNFDYMLNHGHLLDIDSDSLLKIGETLLAEADDEYQKYREYIEKQHQNGRDSVFVPESFTRQDILDYYQWETKQMKVFLTKNNIVTVPDDLAPVEVVETPPFLRSMVAGIAYHPAGAFDSIQKGYFYVRPIPEDLDAVQLAARYRYIHRRGFKGSLVHEGLPGHHLQFQMAARHSSPVRKWQHNTMMVEGWALYCEEMMYHAGLYGDEDPVMWLAILGGIRFRAARIIVDVKLHTGQFTYQQAVDWMINTLDAETESDKNYHRKMVRKYTLTPTKWMAYLMGKREIMKIREEIATKQGKDFSLKQFHDDLLSQGAIPPSLLRKSLGL